MTKTTYRLNIYHSSSGRKIESKIVTDINKLKRMVKDYEGYGFSVDYNTLENGKRKYRDYNENVDDLREQRSRRVVGGML